MAWHKYLLRSSANAEIVMYAPTPVTMKQRSISLFRRLFISLHPFTAVLCAAAFFSSAAQDAVACPSKRGLIDWNCDGQIKVVVVGDSIVYGRGDLDNNNRGGWVKRLGPALRLPAARNLGVPGITSSRLYSRLARKLRNPNDPLRVQAIDADVFIVAVGTNDFFDHGDPSLTAREIKRIVSLARKRLGSNGHVTPYVLVAKLTPTTRGFQRSFIENVNRLLARYRSEALPSHLRFDLMSEDFVSFDGIHPISSGYEQLSTIAAQYLKREGTSAMRSKRPDSDRDGVFNLFERTRFMTDHTAADTDGDGLTDGKEIFTYGTDPLNPDSDGDGRSDGLEISEGTDPLDPLDPPAPA